MKWRKRKNLFEIEDKFELKMKMRNLVFLCTHGTGGGGGGNNLDDKNTPLGNYTVTVFVSIFNPTLTSIVEYT